MAVTWHAIGKRKCAIARVYMRPGSGKFVINHRDEEDYFGRDVLRMVIRQPFELTKLEGRYDIYVNACGGGLSGQADAIKHGISRALIIMNPELRSVLKKAGFLTRDSRVVERKKYGLRKARRRFQFSKR